MSCKESICRNCFHSYVCEQFNENKDDNNEKCHFYNDHYVPTADVVPKSEVEQANKELDNLAEELSDLIVEKDHLFDEVVRLRKALDEYEETSGLKEAKGEVAREIFEEIDRMCIDTFGSFNHRVFAELKKKYTEVAE